MPRAYNYPQQRGCSFVTTLTPLVQVWQLLPNPLRIYVNQWLQNYGYNGLNAGGHGNIVGLKSANAVLMGHTTVREPKVL